MRFARVGEFGGMDVAPDECVALLERLGFTVASRSETSVTVNVPSWRNDVAGSSALEPSPSLPAARAAKAAEGRAAMEQECDLIEEVLRLKGLDNVPPVSLPVAGIVPAATLSPRQQRSAVARRTLAAAGLAECVTFSFMPSETARLFGTAPEALRLVNPIASDLDQMRPTPLATLAMAAQRNAARGYGDVGLFEIGPAFPDAEGQRLVAAGLRAGSTARHWQGGAVAADAMGAKADVWTVLAALGVPMEALSVTADAPGFYHPGQSGTVRQGPKTVLATFGALHPRVLAALDLAGPAVAFEIQLDAIQDPKKRKKSAPDLPSFQPVRRDFAFVVAADLPAEKLLRAAKGADRTLVAGVALFDVYAGDKMEAGKKSLGVEVTFQPREKTLTEAEIEAASAKIVAAVVKATGATLRG
jgi:phenylalanyl-tRNA synthetase beta chain